jgi:ABC-type proline/glycine betaine transport system substrate-binding protein
MKTKLCFTGALILIALTFTSCEALNDCKICKQVTYIDEKWDHETDPIEYCGAALLVVETTADFINGDERTAWECN